MSVATRHTNLCTFYKTVVDELIPIVNLSDEGNTLTGL